MCFQFRIQTVPCTCISNVVFVCWLFCAQTVNYWTQVAARNIKFKTCSNFAALTWMQELSIRWYQPYCTLNVELSNRQCCNLKPDIMHLQADSGVKSSGRGRITEQLRSWRSYVHHVMAITLGGYWRPSKSHTSKHKLHSFVIYPFLTTYIMAGLHVTHWCSLVPAWGVEAERA
jgi:hypothetical protein